MLPAAVLEQVQKEFLNWQDTNSSVIEVSHRGENFIAMAHEAEKDLRELLKIPDNYKVLFLQGGARAQFATIPLNILGKSQSASYIITGHWANCASDEAKKYCSIEYIDVRSDLDEKSAIKPIDKLNISEHSAYVHFCPNETVDGIEINEVPKTNLPIVADLSSTILSRPINISQYGLIYAGAQKNIGPAGMTIVIVREDLLGRANDLLPSVFNYQIQADKDSMYNTPPTFSWYVSGLVFKWLKKNGGLANIYKENRLKAKILYDFIDKSDLYFNNIHKNNRSIMNVTFNLYKPSLIKTFLEEAKRAGLYGLKGHSVVGGLRASIYNAMPLAGVEALLKFMCEFERKF